MKPLKIKDYFEIVNPQYSFLKVTPLKALRNYNSDSIIAAVASTYKKISKQFIKHEKKTQFKRQAKLSYMIYMEKDDISFYFILPNDFLALYKEKISDAWKGVTVELVDALPNFGASSTKYYMTYKKLDAFSLATDKRNNTLLSGILSATDILEDGDRCAVLYNLYPIDQRSWKASYDKAIQKLKDGYPVEREKTNKIFLLKLSIKFICMVCDLALNTFLSVFGDKLPPEGKVPLKDLGVSSATTAKREAKVVGTQILLVSESEDKTRERQSANSLCESFDRVSGDNSLVPVKMKSTKKPIDYTETQLQGVGSFRASPAEAQSFLSLPARELIEEHKIECIEVLESPVPEDLQTGYIPLGTNTYRGKQTQAFSPSSLDAGCFPLVPVGEQGAGKTTLMINYVLSAYKQGEGAIVLDYIKNCELSQRIEERILDKDRLIVLDFSKYDDLQGFGYNEIKPKGIDPMELSDVACQKAQYVSTLLDALNIDGDPLSAPMDRYLSAASNIVLLNPDASLKDVIRCLENYEYREQCVANIPEPLVSILEDEITALKELDSYNKGEKDGTKTSKIEGILNRINLLKKDFRLKLMFAKGTKHNIDLVEAMNEGKIILVKMPQDLFATPYAKNTIVTYFITKIWGAMLVRGATQERPKRFHVLVDEIFQAKTAMRLLRQQEIPPQTRKYSCRFVFSCQNLKQIKEIDETLRSAGASYMLMKGSGKSNFREFAEELEPYTLEHIEALPQYHSLNIINYEKGRVKFITELPKLPPLPKNA